MKHISWIHNKLDLWVDLDDEKSTFQATVRFSHEITIKPCRYGEISEWSGTLPQTCDASEIKLVL